MKLWADELRHNWLRALYHRQQKVVASCQCFEIKSLHFNGELPFKSWSRIVLAPWFHVKFGGQPCSKANRRRKRCNFEKRASPCKAQGATKRASGAQTPQAGADFKKLIEHVLDIHAYALLHAGKCFSQTNRALYLPRHHWQAEVICHLCVPRLGDPAWMSFRASWTRSQENEHEP